MDNMMEVHKSDKTRTRITEGIHPIVGNICIVKQLVLMSVCDIQS